MKRNKQLLLCEAPNCGVQSSIAVIHRQEDEPNEIGINKFELQSDGSVEVMRSFDYLSVDNFAYLAAALQQHVKLVEDMSDDEVTDDDMNDSLIRQRDKHTDSGEVNSAVSENSSDPESPLNVVSDLNGITFGWFDDLNCDGHLAGTSKTNDCLTDGLCLPLLGTRARKRARPFEHR